MSRRRRSLAGGDIVVLLDALMHRLGEGLSLTRPTTISDPEADQATDELPTDRGGPPEEPDLGALARACRGKVRRLVKRMVAQLQLAAEPERARRGVVQLAAVLGVLRMLRVVERRPEWKRKQLELVDAENMWTLFEEATYALAWGTDALAPRAVAEADGGFKELSFAIGLLAWLAWELEVDAEAASRLAGRHSDDESLYAVQLLAAVGPFLVDDPSAVQELVESVRRTPRFHVDGDRWLAVHQVLLEHVALVAMEPDGHGVMGRHPHPGDLVVLAEGLVPRVRVILEVHPTPRGEKVVFWDPDAEEAERAFLASHVRSLSWFEEAADAAVPA